MEVPLSKISCRQCWQTMTEILALLLTLSAEREKREKLLRQNKQNGLSLIGNAVLKILQMCKVSKQLIGIILKPRGLHEALVLKQAPRSKILR